VKRLNALRRIRPSLGRDRASTTLREINVSSVAPFPALAIAPLVEAVKARLPAASP